MKRSAEVGVGVAVVLGLLLVVFGTLWLQGRRLVLINREATARDAAADLLITCGLGEVFSNIT